MPTSRRKNGEGAGRGPGRSDGGGGRRAVTAGRAAQQAARHVVALTGREAEGVTSLERTDHGWTVGIEVVESHRVPDSTDILAIYRVEMDDDGELISYRRDQRYYRGRGQEE